MATITKPYTFSAGATIIAAEHNSNFDTIYSDYNGNITNANLSASAAVVDTKLAQITTQGKVTLGALTIASQAQGDVMYASSATVWTRLGAGTAGQALTTGGAAANPAWAGLTTQGDVEYHNGTTRTRLAPGTSGHFLKTQGAAANPVWAAATETGTWAAVTGSRSAGTVFQNTSGRKRRVAIYCTGAAGGKIYFDVGVGSADPPTLTIFVHRVDVNAAASDHLGSVCFEVPNNWYYVLNVTTGSMTAWHELEE